jgi:WD40 repeat protein
MGPEGILKRGSVSFSPNGFFFASGASDGIKLWNVESEYPIFSTTINDVKNVKNITSIAFSPIDDFIISGASDGSLMFWKIENNGLIIKTIEMHNRGVTSVALSPDSRYIASASLDGIVMLWGFN